MTKGKKFKCAVDRKALDDFKDRIRQLTRRLGGRSMAQVVEKLRPYKLGWKAYFKRLGLPSVLTSSSRNARRGPACRVVWQGRLR
jgi:RNA-directed DNA polymerase